MKVIPIKTRIFKEREDLIAFITDHIKKVKNKSVIVVTSKIVALAEGRVVPEFNQAIKRKIIKAESQFAMETKYCWLTIKDGMMMASAGIDESNADGKLILLPKDSFKAAAEIRKALIKKYRIKDLGVVITDSRTLPLRAGVIGTALGYAGFAGIKDYRGTPDIFGRKFHMSRTDIPDALAAAAVLEMGEGREQKPLAIIEEASIKFKDKINKKEIYIDIKDDMYKPLFAKLL